MSSELYVDFDRCTGHGRCYTEAPDLLTYDEEGFVMARHAPLPLSDDRLPEAEAAVRACPEQAMSIRERTPASQSEHVLTVQEDK